MAEIKNLSPGDVASIITAAVTAVGILLAYLELRRNTRIQRAQFLMGATERYFAESEGRRLFYDLDYNRLKINFVGGNPTSVERGGRELGPFIGSDEERSLDGLLYNFDLIGRLVEIGSLDIREADIFAFQAKRVLENPAVKEYVSWVNRERVKVGVNAPAHRAAYELVEKFEARDSNRKVRNA